MMHIDLFDTEDCDDSGSTSHVVEPAPPLAIRPLSDWLGDIARALSVDIAEPVPRPSKAAPAASLT